MSEWIFFTILAPILWACSNVIDTGVRRNYVGSDSALTWFFCAIRLIPVIVLIFIFGYQFEINSSFWLIFFAGIFWTVPFYFYYKALNSEETSRVVLFMQTLPIVTFIIAAVFFGERLGMNQLIAFVLIFIGSLFAAVKKIETKWKVSVAFFLIFLSVVGWSVSDVVFKYISPNFHSFWEAMIVYLAGGSLPAFLLFLFPSQSKKVFSHLKGVPRIGWFLMSLSFFIGVGGSVSFAYALTLGSVSLSSVIIGIQPLFVFIFGHIFSRIFSAIPREPLDAFGLLSKACALVFVLVGLWYLGLN